MFVRHNKLRNITAQLMGVCLDVGIEHCLQPISNEVLHHKTGNIDDGVRFDVAATNVWDKDRQQSFFDVHVRFF